MTFDETRELLLRLMNPDNFLPEIEQVQERGDEKASAAALDRLRRIEHKLKPDELNPEVLAQDVEELANENRKLEAIQLHRERTGAGLADAKRVLDEFIQKNKK